MAHPLLSTVVALHDLALRVLAAEGGKPHGLWDLKIKGYLVVASAVGLFCGSVYLLLYTNMGSSLAFLVSYTALMGIIFVLSIVWCTSTPYNAIYGRRPVWKVEEVTTANATFADVQRSQIRKLPANTPDADPSIAQTIKADLDAVFGPAKGLEGEAPKKGPFARYTVSGENPIDEWYIIKRVVHTGGPPHRTMPFWWNYHSENAAVIFCDSDHAKYEEDNDFPKVGKAVCDGKGEYIAVLHHDLGSLRQPAYVALLASGLLFGAGLLALKLFEDRERALAAALAAGPPKDDDDADSKKAEPELVGADA